MAAIPANKIYPETLERLGIKLAPPLEQAAKRHLALGAVLKAIQGLAEEDMLWVLHEAKVAHSQQGEVVDNVLTNDNSSHYTAPIGWTVEIVAKAFGVSLLDVLGRRRPPEIVWPRHIAMYILWKTQKFTLAQIGDALGGRTPATVSHGFDVISKAVQRDARLKQRLDEIEEELK